MDVFSNQRRAKKISVVTGGAGFLGSHLSDRLLEAGHQVIAIDNLLTGNLRILSTFSPERISALLNTT